MAKDSNTPATATRPRGRPRSERRRRAILRAATELLAQEGFAGTSVEAIAERAAVSKATIYRWWPNRAAVVMDAFLAEVGEPEPAPDTGSAPEDLRRELSKLTRLLRGRHGRAVASLIAAAQHDAAVAEALRESFLAPRLSALDEVLLRGVERGELRGDLDPHAAKDVLQAPLYHRFLIGHRPLTPTFVASLVEHLVTGMSADGAGAST